jgi:hypothetical protein
MKFKSEVQLEALNNATVDTDKFLVSDSSTVKYRTGSQLLSDLGVSGIYVPYTGATGNVDLGTHTLLAKDLIINHSSGSGIAASITKNGSGEALTVIKGSGSGNAMSVTGGLTSLVNLSLSTVANATGDFLTHSGSTINKRTPAQVLSDIGGQAALTNPITGTGTLNYVSKFTGTTSLGNSQIFDDGSGVGIGTTSPNYTTLGRGVLDINGSSQSMLALSVGGVGKSFLFYTGTDLLISNESNGAIKFNTNSSEKAIITSTGNVGIGTTTPSSRLNVWDSIRAINSTGSFGIESTDVYSAMYMGISSSGYLPFIQGTSRNTMGPISLLLNPNGGNVGIGTTSPAFKLQLRSDSAASSSLDNTAFGLYNNSDGGSAIYFSNAVGAQSKVSFGVESTGAGTDDTYLGFSTGANTTISEKMRITSEGNVGIGTATPNFAVSGRTVLTLNGSSTSLMEFQTEGAFRSYLYQSGGGGFEIYDINNIQFSTAGGERMRVASNGNVGIGTTSPTSVLHIAGGSYPAINIQGGATGGGGFRMLSGASGSDIYAELFGEYESSNNGMMLFRTRGSGTLTERMRITSNGNVGIGTTSPGSTLTIQGTFAVNVGSSEVFVDTTQSYMGYNAGYGFSYVGANESTIDPSDGQAVMVSSISTTEGKLGIQAYDVNSGETFFLVAKEIIQNTLTPIDSLIPVKYIKVYNENDGQFYFINLYQ